MFQTVAFIVVLIISRFSLTVQMAKGLNTSPLANPRPTFQSRFKPHQNLPDVYLYCPLVRPSHTEARR